MKSIRFPLRQLWSKLHWPVPVPVRLPHGGWWLADADVTGDRILAHRFEVGERRFVARFLDSGMTVLDIGAHHGFYTVLASRSVGSSGMVIAFEPSPRERAKLIRHLLLNRCRNVAVESLALGDEVGDAELYVVRGRETGLNSLRPPITTGATRPVTVRMETLDHYLGEAGLVDFIKLDVEGGELDVLKGARKTLSRSPRPIILCEVYDVRTIPWDYPARLIVKFLEELSFHWFDISSLGDLTQCLDRDRYSANLLAVPKERLPEIEPFTAEVSD